mmetsp:Transcript_2802/g.5149  ORF Transcript_2802/g.5149 Transcript_2802/m.5149 type:complete len:218 (-) Transcript_2802:200-853(-)
MILYMGRLLYLIQRCLYLTDNVGIDMRRVATWGTSAGGYMAAQMARRMTHKDRNLSYQVALIPMAKPHGGTRSAMKYWHHSAWTGPQNVIAWSSFLPDDDGTLAADWKLSLLVDPPKETLDQLPPELCEEGGMEVRCARFCRFLDTQLILRFLHRYAHRLARRGKLISLKNMIRVTLWVTWTLDGRSSRGIPSLCSQYIAKLPVCDVESKQCQRAIS